MPPDPNARLIKALEDNTRALGENTRAVNALLKEWKRTRVVTPQTHPYLEPTPPEPQTEEYQSPYGSGPSQSDR
jgi:hypothetical protein